MTPAISPELGVVVLGRGESDDTSTTGSQRRAGSSVRYADPAAWRVADAMTQAIATVAAECTDAQDQVGIVLVSDEGPAETRTTVARSARDGFVSPLRFVAAPPASLIGVACIVMSFYGPTLNLTTPARTGVPAALTIATRWLDRRKVRFAIVATYGRWHGRGLVARCVLLARDGPSPGAGALPNGLEPSWLIPPR